MRHKYEIYHHIPNIIQYCHFIFNLAATFKEKPLLCFVSRDGYYVKIFFNKLYPNEMKTKYVYHSRKLCYSPSKTYLNYIRNILNSSKYTLWIDGQGSGTSHYNFFSKFFGSIPTKVFYSLNKNVKHLHSMNIHFFNQKEPIEYLDNLFTAPHASVTMFNDACFKHTVKDNAKTIIYKEIIDNLFIHEKLVYRCTTTQLAKHDKNMYGSILALDIDDTINKKLPLLSKIVTLCNIFKSKIVLITSRQIPYKYGKPNNQIIEKIEDIFEMNNLFRYFYTFDIFYYPYTFSTKGLSGSHEKLATLKKIGSEYSINKDKMLFIDDNTKNTSLAEKNGYKVANAINNESYELFKAILNNKEVILPKIPIDNKPIPIPKKRFLKKSNRPRVIFT